MDKKPENILEGRSETETFNFDILMQTHADQDHLKLFDVKTLKSQETKDQWTVLAIIVALFLVLRASSATSSEEEEDAPPRVFDMLFWLALPSKTREHQLGDMEEDYRRTLKRFPDRRGMATLDYLWQGLSFVIQSYWQYIERVLFAWLKGA